MKDDILFFSGFTLASVIYLFVYCSSSLISINEIVDSCKNKNYFIYKSTVIECKTYFIK